MANVAEVVRVCQMFGVPGRKEIALVVRRQPLVKCLVHSINDRPIVEKDFVVIWIVHLAKVNAPISKKNGIFFLSVLYKRLRPLPYDASQFNPN